MKKWFLVLAVLLCKFGICHSKDEGQAKILLDSNISIETRSYLGVDSIRYWTLEIFDHNEEAINSNIEVSSVSIIIRNTEGLVLSCFAIKPEKRVINSKSVYVYQIVIMESLMNNSTISISLEDKGKQKIKFSDIQIVMKSLLKPVKNDKPRQ